MRWTTKLAVIVLLFSARFAFGQGCANCTHQCPKSPITIVNQQQLPPQYGPTIPVQAPTLFQRQILPPQYTAASPPAPITLFNKPAPPIETYSLPVPQLTFCQSYVPPPLYADMPPRSNITLFQRTMQPIESGPTVPMPSITLYNRGQPPPAHNLGTVCTYQQGCGGHQPR